MPSCPAYLCTGSTIFQVSFGRFRTVLSRLWLIVHFLGAVAGTLIQIRRALRPDGVFIGSMFGGDTLFELRYAPRCLP